MNPDPFGTGALRDGVLAAWRGSPTRFREDANAESDLVHGGYAERLLVELAQNAADAAQRAGAAGRLRLELVGGQLRAANTGAPLDAAGVTALASLRASAKRDDAAVGRFGVGFSAVLTVSDAPRLVSTTGGVQFSAARTVVAVAGDALLDSELARRGGRAPVLRLVWPVDDDEPAPPAGFDTEVRLPLRDGLDGADVLAQCASQAVDLLLALPWLQRIDVADRTLTREGDDPVVVRGGDAVSRWRMVRRSGRLDGGALAALGPEAQPAWSLCWALPVDEGGTPLPLGADVLHAPTATAETLTLPARLIATVPLESSRRHVHAGPAADAVLAAAAAAYPQLAAALDPPLRIALVPEPGFPAGEVDATLREQVLAALRDATWLPAADGGELSPARARVLDVPVPGLVELLTDADGGLVAAELAEPRHAPALAALGVTRIAPAALVELLAGLDRPPSWWHRCYVALAGLLDADPAARDALGALPVPLTGGRTVTGPRGVLLGGDDVPGVDVPGLRLAHPDAAHPLLERLGARPVGPAELLDALRPAIERSVEDADEGADVGPLATAVLGLAARLADPPSRRPWLGGLALLDADGEPGRADELVAPDAALRPVVASDAPLGVLAGGYPAEAVRAVGVLDSFALLDEPDPTEPDHELDDEEGWWAAIDGDAAPPSRLLAVRDLDLVDEACWPAALGLLASDPATTVAVREPDGYTGWWLARHAVLDGTPLRQWRLPSATGLTGLYDPVVLDGLDDSFLAAAGVRAALYVEGPDDAADLLARLADPARWVTPAVVHAAHAALAAAVVSGVLDPVDVDPPSRVRTRTGEVVAADRAVVLDEPWLTAVLRPDSLVAGGDAATLAELLDLPLASEQVTGAELLDRDAGRQIAWAELVDIVAACAAASLPVPCGSVVLHGHLQVRHGGAVHDVAYWVEPDGTVHATDPLRALLRP
ncbi:MAG: hypothetical protein GEU83_09570 [Pseudonocardiaceae bacterium]|nr:hypothetical protein [Pseudonocardiaceae bacterium]